MVARALDVAVGALIFLSSILSVLKKSKKSVMSALCHEGLTWPICVSRGGKPGRQIVSMRIMVERVWLDLGWITHALIIL